MSGIEFGDKESVVRSGDSYTPLVRIYPDASCIRNGAIDSSAGCGAVMLDQNRLEIKCISKYAGQITNQQAEILACTLALQQLQRSCRVEIVSDSRYLIDTMSGLNRMRTNRLFWARLVKACYGHHIITWRWVKGHSGVPFQEVADRLARASAQVCSDLNQDDLEQLSVTLSESAGQFNIRDFEVRLEKVVSRYRQAEQVFIAASGFSGAGPIPSAFSA